MRGTVPALPHEQETAVDLPASLSGSIPASGSRMYFETTNKHKHCVTASIGTPNVLLLSPYIPTDLMTLVNKKIGSKIEKVALLRTCTVSVVSSPWLAQVAPMQPAVASSAIAFPAAPNAALFPVINGATSLIPLIIIL